MTAKIYALDSVQSLADFELGALRVAEVIGENGVTTGDRVILKAGNSAPYVSVLFALMHVGASIVLIDQQESLDETRRIARRTGAVLALVDDDALLPDDIRAMNVYELIVAAAGRPLGDSVLSFDAWCARPDALVMWTSGSTGEPKGAVKSGRKFLTNLERNAAQVGHRPDDVLLPLLPFAHQYGLSMVLIAWLTRCSLVIAPYKRLDRAMQMAGRTGATVIDATPSNYRTMLNLIDRKPSLRAHLEQVRMFCSGAAPLDAALSDRYTDAFGLPLLDSYGSTELGNIAFATLDNPVSCGRVMDGIKLRVVTEDGRQAAPGQAGEIEVDTPDALEGHLVEDGTVEPVATGWHPTGDLGHLDYDGNLYVLGRKFAVHRSGYTLYPELVERKAALAGICTRIVPLHDERRGDAQLVFFVEDEQLRDARYWRERLGQALPVYEQPNRVEVLADFPLNRNGKPDKRRLEQIAFG